MDFLFIYKNIIFSFIAIFFVIFSLMYAFKIKSVFKYIFLILSFLLLIFNIIYIYIDNFTSNGIDLSFYYHLQFGNTGINNYVIFRTIVENLKLTILIILFLIISIFVINFVLKKNTKRYYLFYLFAFFVSIFFSKGIYDIYDLYKILSTSKKSDFYDYYKIPNLTDIGNSSKNLIYIYLESFERTLLKPEFTGLSTNLKELSGKYTSFSNIHEDFGMMRTIAGMVASQCGIPLIGGNDLVYLDKFLPRATCMGDILKNKGYYNVYVGGANLEFAGKGKFYKTHGFDEIYGFYELKKYLKNAKYNHWGYNDEYVMDFVYKKYIELKQNKKKFSLFTITLDTHDEGVVDDICKKNINYNNLGYKKYLGKYKVLDAFKCSDYIVGNLVRKLVDAGALKDTVIVLQSDHYVMGISSISKYIRSKYKFNERGIYLTIIDDTGSKLINKRGLTIDIGASVLSVMGFKVDYLGLGRNLFNKNIKTLFEKGVNLKKFISELSSFNSMPKFNKIKVENNRIILGNASFSYPIYMMFDENWNLKSFVVNPYLLKSVYKNYKNYKHNFILINSCNFWSKKGDICYVKNNKFYLLTGGEIKVK